MCYDEPTMRGFRWLSVLAAAVLAAAPGAAAQGPDLRALLAQARKLYNQREYDRAIAIAEQVATATESSDDADLIIARASLERYRLTAELADLTTARERLRRIRPERLVGNGKAEFVIGLGETLYFDRAPGAAASLFESALAQQIGGLEGRERILDWWASAIDGDARPRSELERQSSYERIRVRMRDELGKNPASSAAAYWLAAAARGQGDLQAAWDAAQAGWVLAPLSPDRGAALRGELERLVQRALIPERARLLAQSPEQLREEWEAFKGRWER
jgi:hypothetical protein